MKLFAFLSLVATTQLALADVHIPNNINDIKPRGPTIPVDHIKEVIHANEDSHVQKLR